SVPVAPLPVLTLVRNPMNVSSVGRRLVVTRNLFHIRAFILMRHLMNVKNVGRPLSGFIHFSPSITGFILARNPTNVSHVRRPLDSIYTLFNIRRFIMEFSRRKPSNIHCFRISESSFLKKKIVSCAQLSIINF
uniref:Uncharacterized protein n=1 Tax=Oryctolagus cuniculus TaxID=9986 RepID=A0A5F9C8X5_RABIT